MQTEFSLVWQPGSRFACYEASALKTSFPVRHFMFGFYIFPILAWLLSLIAIVPAFAAQSTTLAGPAISVRAPAGNLLISVTNAGSRLVAVGGHGLIIYSDDFGKSWHQSVSPVNQTITSVAFATPQDGWAAGAAGIILHSIDGGLTWTTQITGAQILPLMLAAANRVATANPADDMAQRALHRANIFMQAGASKPMLAILPINAQTALVFGAYRMTLLTKDGGKTWMDWSLHVGDPVSHNIYDVIRAGASIYLAGETGVVLRSDDQGNSFSLVTSPNLGTLLGILGTKSNTLLTFGVAGQIFRSMDRGQTWSQSNISVTSDLTAGIVLKSGKIVVVSEDGGIFMSSDDGKTFQSVSLNEGMELFGLTQAANGQVILVGSGGVRVAPETAFN